MATSGPHEDLSTGGPAPAAPASPSRAEATEAAPAATGSEAAPAAPPARERRWTVSRRAFTARLGASLLAAPFVDLLVGPRKARAATGTAKRLVIFFSPNGTFPNQWHPTGTGTSFSFPAGSIYEPLKPYQQELVVVGGLEFKNASNHAGGMAAMLTASGTASDESAGMSVDQYVASKIGGGTRLKSLELGVQTSIWGAGEQTRMCYSAAKQFAPPDDDPVSVYGRVFGGGGGTGSSDPTAARRVSVLDAVKSDLRDLRARLGSEEAKKLDQHLASVQELERSMGINACSGGSAPTPVAKDQNDNFPTIGKTQMDLLVGALACGATRVATLQWSFTVSPVVFSWLGISDQHHTLSHVGDSDTVGVKKFVDCERWFVQQYVYLLDKLAATADPAGGTLLDSTLVVYAREMGEARLHNCIDVPFILAGSQAFTKGRYLQTSGAAHAQLMVSICQAMGLDTKTFGPAAVGTGPLAGL